MNEKEEKVLPVEANADERLNDDGLIWGERPQQLSFIRPPCRDRQIAIPIGFVNMNPWTSLAVLTIDLDKVRHRYTCSYTSFNCDSIIPVILWTNDWDKYRSPVYQNVGHAELLFDLSRIRYQMQVARPNDYMSNVHRILMGSGYIFGHDIYDGQSRLAQASVLLTNGDIIEVRIWRWNKHEA